MTITNKDIITSCLILSSHNSENRMFLLSCADFLQDHDLTLLFCISAASENNMVINTNINCHGQLALAACDHAETARQRSCDLAASQRVAKLAGWSWELYLTF